MKPATIACLFAILVVVSAAKTSRSHSHQEVRKRANEMARSVRSFIKRQIDDNNNDDDFQLSEDELQQLIDDYYNGNNDDE